MIIAFYGDGKGKTSAAIGIALRSLNTGRRVSIIQLFKIRENFRSNEIEFLLKLKSPKLSIKQFGLTQGWVDFKHITQEVRELATSALKFAQGQVEFKLADLIILDEFLLADYYNVFGKKELLQIISSARTYEVDMILTGAKIDKQIIKHCDLVTEMKNIKHPFEKGTLAKEGIDF